MTEPRDEAPALPLTVTCTPDGQLAEALQALVGRVGALAGDPSRAQPFVTAVQRVVRWVTDHPDAVAGDLALVIDRADGTLLGDLRWALGTQGGVPPAAASPVGVEVSCGVSGDEVHCRVSCPCV
jgi:hypothetical protein